MNRLTDHDKTFGPLTVGRIKWRATRLHFRTGADEDPGNNITAYAFGWVVRLALPTLLHPHRTRVDCPGWDAETVARLGRNWYWQEDEREYGFSLSDGEFFQIHYGRQTHSSETTKSWSWFLPWTQWRHIRTSFYDQHGAHFYSNTKKRNYDEQSKAEAACPKVDFLFEDYDGAVITATTHIQEMEWSFGEGWFSWLRFFRPNKIRRSLDMAFSAEVGNEKGSWKGGTVGCGIDMLPRETHEDAFHRWCASGTKDRRGRLHALTFIR